MTDENKWQEPLEDDGVTLGPEEALRREIEKSKSLKVERLKLKDEIEKLSSRVDRLTEENQALKEEISRLKKKHPESFANQTGDGEPANWFACISPLVILLTLCGTGLLLFFLFR